MVKFLTRAGKNTGNLLALSALTVALAACGGGSGDTDPLDTVPLGEQDLDGDNIPNEEDSDSDGDGIEDAAVDLNGNRLDTFIDWDGDQTDDATGEVEDFEPEPETPITPDPVTANAPCGDEPGGINNGSTAAWNNNCLIRVNDGGDQGQFANSLYTVGIQRIIYCAAGSAAAGATYANFADGRFGPNTEAALRTFQASNPGPITDDGEVGPETWGKLQAALGTEPLVTGEVDGNGVSQNAYGVSGGRCEDIPLFYQTVAPDGNGQRVVGGWKLAKNAPNTSAAQAVSFSIDPVGTQLQ